MTTNRSWGPIYEKCLREAFELYRRHFLLLLLVHIAVAGMSVFSLGILAGPLAAGACMVALDLVRKREPAPQLGRIFAGLELFLPTFLLFLATFLVMVVASTILWGLRLGRLSWLLPLVVNPVVVPALYLIIESKLTMPEAVQQAWTRARPVLLPLGGLLGVGWLVGSVGSWLHWILGVLTMPFFTCVTALVWEHWDEWIGTA